MKNLSEKDPLFVAKTDSTIEKAENSKLKFIIRVIQKFGWQCFVNLNIRCGTYSDLFGNIYPWIIS